MAKPDKRLWHAPRIWPDGECFIIGGGPSVMHLDLERLRRRRVLAVNMAFKLADWFDVMFFGDCRYYARYYKDLLDFAGLKVTTCEQHLDKPGIKVIKRRNGTAAGGLSFSKSVVQWNRSSGACAINLAVLFGVRRIVLLGFDMKENGSDHHWHKYYIQPNAKSIKRTPYKRFMEPFPTMAEMLKRKNIECVNACPDSAMDAFPRMSFEDAL